MAASRHKRTQAVLLRTEMREFINRKQRGPVKECEWLADWDKVRGTVPPLPFFSSFTPTTLPPVRQRLSPQNPPALFPDEAPIRPMKPDPGLLMEPVKYHRFKNPCVINIPGSPASIQIIPFRNSCIQYMQKYHICIAGCTIWLTLTRLHMMRLTFFDASKTIICIFPWRTKGNKKLLTEAQIFHFLLKAADSSRTCARITIIICYYCVSLLWEVFPNGSGLLRVEPYSG